mmetsp:Transcript_4116/g.9894  ORF Transcript_4116/g.9894 Transcript_4116/m.9894 type:complete len:247 (-) Transcript_4116:601-1341(-)
MPPVLDAGLSIGDKAERPHALGPLPGGNLPRGAVDALQRGGVLLLEVHLVDPRDLRVERPPPPRRPQQRAHALRRGTDHGPHVRLLGGPTGRLLPLELAHELFCLSDEPLAQLRRARDGRRDVDAKHRPLHQREGAFKSFKLQGRPSWIAAALLAVGDPLHEHVKRGSDLRRVHPLREPQRRGFALGEVKVPQHLSTKVVLVPLLAHVDECERRGLKDSEGTRPAPSAAAGARREGPHPAQQGDPP